MFEPRQLTLLLLIVAGTLLYVGTRLAWAGLGGFGERHPLLRGMLLAGPLAALAVWFVLTRHVGDAVSLLVSGAAVMLTLGLGIVGLSTRPNDEATTPVLRTILPIAACVCLIGFVGLLRWEHAAFVVVIAGLMLWSLPRAAGGLGRPDPQLQYVPLLIAVPLLLAGLWVCLQGLSISPVLTQLAVGKPAIVLLFVFAAIGLLASEAQLGRPTEAIETVGGYVIACVGLVLPAVIVLGKFLALGSPVAEKAVVMPLYTWRIDSVLLTAVGALLLPIGLGRFGLGRFEGVLLTLAAIAFLITSIFAGLRLG